MKYNIQIGALVSLFSLSLVSTAQACKTQEIETAAVIEQEAPQNYVMEPAYAAPKKEEKSKPCEVSHAAKLQYAIEIQEAPPVQEKAAPAERTNGAEYEKGIEVFVAPKPDVLIKDEEITDQEEQIEDIPSAAAK